jgi:hypothetical protein
MVISQGLSLALALARVWMARELLSLSLSCDLMKGILPWDWLAKEIPPRV